MSAPGYPTSRLGVCTTPADALHPDGEVRLNDGTYVSQTVYVRDGYQPPIETLPSCAEHQRNLEEAIKKAQAARKKGKS